MNNKKLAIIADDDIDYLSQIELYLKKMGFSVQTAETQSEAEELIEAKKPDLAIFDLMMDNHDTGFILCYKTKKKYPDVPVVLLTAVTAETGIQFGLEEENSSSWINADLYLVKDLRQDQFNREISKLLK